jgi:hypothetical protein
MDRSPSFLLPKHLANKQLGRSRNLRFEGMFFRTLSGMRAITLGLTGVLTSAGVGLALRLTTWKARWYVMLAFLLFFGLLVVLYRSLIFLNRFLIRWFAHNEFHRERERLAEEFTAELLRDKVITFPVFDDLIQREAARSIQACKNK